MGQSPPGRANHRSLAPSSKAKFLQQVLELLLLGLVAFSLSGALVLLLKQDYHQALFMGSVAVPATYSAVFVFYWRRQKQEKKLKIAFRQQIQSLEEQRDNLHLALKAAFETRQEIDLSIQGLEREQEQLVARLSELYQHRNDLYAEIVSYSQQRQALMGKSNSPKPPQLQGVEQAEENSVDRAFYARTLQIQQTEQRLQRLHGELGQIKSQILEQIDQRDRLQKESIQLSQHQQVLITEIQELQDKVESLEQYQEQLSQSLAPIEQKRQECEESYLRKQGELALIQSQIKEAIAQQQQLNNYSESKQIKDKKPEIVTKSGENLPREWLSFLQGLDSQEKSALRAILEQNEAELKAIADRLMVMPEVLVELLNEKALNTIGDLILTHQPGSSMPVIQEEYLAIIVEPITLQFKDLLEPKD